MSGRFPGQVKGGRYFVVASEKDLCGRWEKGRMVGSGLMTWSWKNCMMSDTNAMHRWELLWAAAECDA